MSGALKYTKQTDCGQPVVWSKSPVTSFLQGVADRHSTSSSPSVRSVLLFYISVPVFCDVRSRQFRNPLITRTQTDTDNHQTDKQTYEQLLETD